MKKDFTFLYHKISLQKDLNDSELFLKIVLSAIVTEKVGVFVSEEIKSPENTGQIQEKGRYRKGRSGNPNGKPKGARNRSTLAAEALLEGSLDKICKRVEEEALNGNMQAAKMILERFLPPRKDRCIKIDLPPITTYSDVLNAVGFIVNAVGKGKITPSEGELLSRTVESYSKALESYQLESRLKSIEESINKKLDHEVHQ